MSGILRKAATGLGVVGVIIAGLSAAGVSSWASGASSPQQGEKVEWITPKEAPAAYQRFTAEFPEPLPDGIGWPSTLPANLLEKGVRMEKEVPLSVASFYWLCAWEGTYLTQSKLGDADGSRASLATIDRFIELPFYKDHFDDPEMLWYSAVIGAAKSGDPSGIESNFAGCSFYHANNG